MRNKLIALAFIAAIIAWACSDANITGPSPGGPPGPSDNGDVAEPAPIEPVYPKLNTEFSWNLARGFTLFAGARADEDSIRELFQSFEAQWPHLRKTARVCAEVQSWPSDRAWLPRGVSAKPFDSTAPAFLELKNFLDVVVTIPDAQVLVVPVCNLKEDGTSQDNIEKWVRATCRLTSQYPNTAVEVINEAQHPNSSFQDAPHRVHRMLRACRDASVRSMQIGTDSNINERNREYEYNRGLVDFLSYHPWRNPDPTKEDLRGIVRGCIGCTVFSETTALDVERYTHGGLVSADPLQIEDYARHAEKAGGVFVYHTVWGLGWPVLPIGHIIPRGDWEIRHGR